MPAPRSPASTTKMPARPGSRSEANERSRGGVMSRDEPTDFLYPFIDAQEDDAASLLADLAASARAKAHQRGLYTVGFAGYDGGAFADNPNVDACFVVSSQSVHRIQEAQALLGYQLWAGVQAEKVCS